MFISENNQLSGNDNQIQKMISSVHIKNFQSHKDTEFNFHNGVNVIIGSSDCGKSAIIRALRWVLNNSPSGDAFRSHWGGDTEVKLKIQDDEVIRKKTNKDNLYSLNGNDLKAIGMDVPDEIRQVLNMGEINVQGQLDSSFLLSKSPGQVAQHFNKIANLEQIDTSISNVNSAITKLKQRIQSNEERKLTAEESLKQYDWLEKFEAEVEVLEEMERDIENMVKKRYLLISLCNDIRRLERDIKQNEAWLVVESDVVKSIKLIRQKEGLTTSLVNIEEYENELEKYKSLLAIESIVNAALRLHTILEEKKEEKKSLTNIINSLNALQTEEKTMNEKLIKMQKRFKENMPDICPLCESQIIRSK